MRSLWVACQSGLQVNPDHDASLCHMLVPDHKVSLGLRSVRVKRPVWITDAIWVTGQSGLQGQSNLVVQFESLMNLGRILAVSHEFLIFFDLLSLIFFDLDLLSLKKNIIANCNCDFFFFKQWYLRFWCTLECNLWLNPTKVQCRNIIQCKSFYI